LAYLTLIKKQIERILKCAAIKPSCLQIESHPYLTQEKLISFCQNSNIQVVAYSPLGSPHRPWGKDSDPSLLNDPTILQIAKNLKKTPAQILLRFHVQRGISVIPATSNKERLIENLQVTNFTLSDKAMNSLKSLNRNFRYCYPTFTNKYGEQVDELDRNHPEYPFHEEF